MNTHNVVIIVLVLLLILTLFFGCKSKGIMPYEGFEMSDEQKKKMADASGNIKEMVEENSDKIEEKINEIKQSLDELKQNNDKEAFTMRKYEGFSSYDSGDLTCSRCEKCVSGCSCSA